MKAGVWRVVWVGGLVATEATPWPLRQSRRMSPAQRALCLATKWQGAAHRLAYHHRALTAIVTRVAIGLRIHRTTPCEYQRSPAKSL